MEYLYLDLATCARCISTDAELAEVLRVLTPALRMAGYRIDYRKLEMRTADIARAHRFVSSPTIRVNGMDIAGPVRENACGCCSDISGTDVDCRVWTADGQTLEVPTRAMLAEGILKAVFAQPAGQGQGAAYGLPDNLKAFFDGRNACCPDGCTPQQTTIQREWKGD